MNFAVQAGNPATLRPPDVAADMSDAIGEIYPLETEDAILIWNLVPIRLSYRYDLSVLVDDLVPLLEKVQEDEFTSGSTHWGSDTFSAEWKIVRTGQDLTITAKWLSTLGNYEELLNARAVVSTSLSTFVHELTKLLIRTSSDINAVGVELEDQDIFQRAEAIIARQ
ncbi:hypothetical protein [Saccharopolyspora spinosa]|uniref:Uncharacterized protein n=1 Tax=Saccharopolyspora spinosa TaxID=60894 RepID=A0A2N3Y9K2_SACSN|nr:hypothetical protein [Saccharopolyspora spinosa]PKW19531.1 hypothetical protein A8926_7703 [Saccharopolyspora spinosa]